MNKVQTANFVRFLNFVKKTDLPFYIGAYTRYIDELNSYAFCALGYLIIEFADELGVPINKNEDSAMELSYGVDSFTDRENAFDVFRKMFGMPENFATVDDYCVDNHINVTKDMVIAKMETFLEVNGHKE